MCRLRSYAPGDAPHVFALMQRSLADYGLCADPGATDSDLRDIDATYVRTGGVFKILDDDGVVVGSYGLLPLSPRTCELRKMYLAAGHRGRGLGKRMMEDALASARALGFSEMVLETNTCLREALAMYRAHGFEDYTPDHLSGRCNLGLRKTL
jgi:putative acetyltransferase